MTALSVALVVIAALAWDAYRRTLALRRVDQLEELRAAVLDLRAELEAKANTRDLEAVAEELKSLRKDVELSGRSRR